ncbi:MAG: Trm112 family protein [Acidobacteriota bacterium]
MNSNLLRLDVLACPACRGDLQPEADRLCCAACGRRYPVIDGIPVLIAERAEAPSHS